MGADGWEWAFFGVGCLLPLAVLLVLFFGSTVSRVIAGVLWAAILVTCVLLLRIYARPVVLNATELRIPKTTGSTVLPLARIAEVVVVFRESVFEGSSPRYHLEVFDVSGRSHPLHASTSRVKQWAGERVPEAKTLSGRRAKEIYGWVLARQAPDGPLRTLDLLTTRKWGPPDRSWWSPDGRSQALPEPAASVPPAVERRRNPGS
jgi:hypothetical protein